MIISHQHKFIFFAVPKTGTHAIRRMLRPFLGPDDWEQENLFEKKRLPIKELAVLNHGHISVNQLKPILNPDIWDNYFKFAVVRNPYERYISTCSFLLRSKVNKAELLRPFIQNALAIPTFASKIITQTQTSFLEWNGAVDSLDYIGRLENMDEIVNTIRQQTELPISQIEVINKSEHQQYTDYASDGLNAKILYRYASDFENFSYKKNNS